MQVDEPHKGQPDRARAGSPRKEAVLHINALVALARLMIVERARRLVKECAPLPLNRRRRRACVVGARHVTQVVTAVHRLSARLTEGGIAPYGVFVAHGEGIIAAHPPRPLARQQERCQSQVLVAHVTVADEHDAPSGEASPYVMDVWETWIVERIAHPAIGCHVPRPIHAAREQVVAKTRLARVSSACASTVARRVLLARVARQGVGAAGGAAVAEAA